MTVKLYSCGMMDNPREREMMKSLVVALQKRYRDYDDCIMLVEPEFVDEQYGFLHKPDCIIFKDNTIIVIELKNWLGEFEIALERHSWKVKGDRKLQAYVDGLREKPDEQCIRHSKALKELLVKRFSGEFIPDKYQIGKRDDEIYVQWAKVLREYVLLKPGSNIKVKSSSFDPKPRILTSDNFPNEISQLRKEQKWLPESVVDKLISMFHGRTTDIDHLFSKPNQLEGEETLDSVREYVRNLLGSDDPKAVLTGLELSISMKLKSLYEPIRDIYLKSKAIKIRINALKSIISLDHSDLKYLFLLGLNGKDSELIEFILDLIIKYPFFSDISGSLEELFNNKDLDIIYKSIKAMSLNRTSKSCEFFEATLTDIFASGPYLSVNTLSKLEAESNKTRNSDSKANRRQYYQHSEVHREKNVYVGHCISCRQEKLHRDLLLKHVKAVALIEAMGSCNCRNGVNLITDVIEHPESLGIPTLNVLFDENIPKPGVYLHDKPAFSSILKREVGNHINYYFDLLKFGLNAIANMAYHQAIETFRIVLQIPDEDAKNYAIRALGKLGGNRELDLLKPFIQEDDDSHLKYLAIISLTEMGEVGVFNQIVNIYFSSMRKFLEWKMKTEEDQFDSYGTDWVYKASKDYLLKVDPSGFEHILLDRIAKERSDEIKHFLFNDLFYFSTEESADLSFGLLENENLHDIAEGILFRLSDTGKVIIKGKELLTSQIEEKRAFAYRLLNVYFKTHIDELDSIPINSDSDLKSKLDLYSYMGLWQRLLGYLSYPQKDIREYALDALNYVPDPMKLKEHYEWIIVDNVNHSSAKIEMFSLEKKLILKSSTGIKFYDFDKIEISVLQMEEEKTTLCLNPIEGAIQMYLRLQNKTEYAERNFHSIIGLLTLIGKEIDIDRYKNSCDFPIRKFSSAGLDRCNMDYVHWSKLWHNDASK